ncbi:ClpXP adapter SpxH family protein [Virgibacillus sp. W0181]|uniref:ClpXP adapter SpxH family protein n=1 Tax=Virgibacillus sp. W0181 TaxID=3391581 RepID=UPI003F44F42C
MVWNLYEQPKANHADHSVKYNFIDFIEKPIEIYAFIDPLCPECWTLDPIFKKLSIEYGRFFTIRPVISGRLVKLRKKSVKNRNPIPIWEKTDKFSGISCDRDLKSDNFPWSTSMAIKAAELQGNRAGRLFLRKVQEAFFINNEDISDEKTLIRCAENAKLDVEEFSNDLQSSSAKKAFQCDLKILKDMNVDTLPTLVFFNHVIEDHGIKITGFHHYDTYVHILREILQVDMPPAKKPPLEDFLAHYGMVGNKELSVIYDWTLAEAEREMKKLQLKRKVKKINVKHDSIWKYIS